MGSQDEDYSKASFMYNQLTGTYLRLPEKKQPPRASSWQHSANPFGNLFLQHSSSESKSSSDAPNSLRAFLSHRLLSKAKYLSVTRWRLLLLQFSANEKSVYDKARAQLATL
jgi:hypothetical protein